MLVFFMNNCTPSRTYMYACAHHISNAVLDSSTTFSYSCVIDPKISSVSTFIPQDKFFLQNSFSSPGVHPVSGYATDCSHFSPIPAANLLINYNVQRLKVADFGCAELLEECHLGPCFRGNEKAGTLTYNPPEVYIQAISHTHSYFCILYVL